MENHDERARVLVVDDHEHTADMLRDLLEANGHEVRTAASVDDALAALRESAFDLVLTDFAMPGRTGVVLVRTVHDDPALQSIPCAIMSGHGGRELLRGLGDAHNVTFLRKPFELQAILQLARRAAAGRARRTS